ncbi:MAG: methionyl-tRNA formyltransferase [Planctomycetes bacterium]|nr:methionyl-tRNA formyltransferase [Planctomycetota bacterium]
MTVLFMGSGSFGLPTLRRLARTEVPLTVATVPDAPRGRLGQAAPTPIKACALELGLRVLESETLKGEHGRCMLQDSGARLAVVADYRLMLTRSFLAGVECGCFNLHGSILPRWRGAAPIQHAILSGDTEFGVTLYRMVRALDAGPIVATRSYRPEGRPDAPEVEEHLAELAAELTIAWLPRLLDQDIPLLEQDERQATLAPKLTKGMGWIDWKHEPVTIVNQVRALKPWPRTFAMLVTDGGMERLFIDAVDVAERDDRVCAPGEITVVNTHGLEVACGSGRERVRVTQVQRAGKRSLPIADFLRGTSVSVGHRLEKEESEA